MRIHTLVRLFPVLFTMPLFADSEGYKVRQEAYQRQIAELEAECKQRKDNGSAGGVESPHVRLSGHALLDSGPTDPGSQELATALSTLQQDMKALREVAQVTAHEREVAMSEVKAAKAVNMELAAELGTSQAALSSRTIELQAVHEEVLRLRKECKSLQEAKHQLELRSKQVVVAAGATERAHKALSDREAEVAALTAALQEMTAEVTRERQLRLEAENGVVDAKLHTKAEALNKDRLIAAVNEVTTL